MMVVLDPSRVFVGKPESFGGYGDYLATMCERYSAVGGINGGAYYTWTARVSAARRRG